MNLTRISSLFPAKQVTGCSCSSYSVRGPTESLFWTSRVSSLFEVFGENGAKGSSLVPSATGLPKVGPALILLTLCLPMLSFQQKTLTLQLVGRGRMTDVKILFHGLLSQKAPGSCLGSDHC